ncbi:regulatory protein [Calothrix sp. NIES-2100]|uniref:NB-ARC domain-containing protein n=1 Tax=Calothrix sp. NIES-2100 TaxID=1954172 RepID=UPI000B6087A7|nr:regulatory protein [Calothrix sp. NIES-2100]
MARESSKGPVIQKRVKRLLEALLCFADGEVEEDKFKIKYRWTEEDSANPKLTIETTLVRLEALTGAVRNPTPNPSSEVCSTGGTPARNFSPQARRGKDDGGEKLTKAQIREALNLLKDFVKILEDNRIHTQGSDDWHFTLKLWSRDKEKNLKRFDEVWESNKPKKSKELEANYTEDEGVAVVPQTKLAIFQAPPLPAHFVERPEYSDELKTRFLTEDNRTLVITAIHGLGSVGKSTLAAALAVDAEVQTRFCDGILWATLGQKPDVLSLISGWVQALGDYSFKPTSVEATSTHLRTLLYDKAVLLVVDDAWNTQDAQAFNVGGVRCQVLVTTREGAIAEALAASTYSLDIMKPSQAMALLTKKLRREITGAERQSAENLAQGVGYLPLALELAAAEVASGTTWDELLADIRQEVARLTSFDRPEAEEITDEASLKRLSLTASLNLSVKRMPQEKQQHFARLGVLPEDVNINKMMAGTLWGMGERDAAKMLQYLRNKALLLTGVPLADGTPTYRLHDLFHDLACNLLTAAPQPKRIGDLPGLGLQLVDAHAAFLEKYRQKIHKNLWHTLPNDGYIHQHLVWHLEKAGRVEEIHSLLREESATGNNGWYEAREKLAQTGGYITDISRAWELAEANWNESTTPQVVGWQCRYALITASLNSLAANVPIELLVALVKNNLWTAEQGLAYALQNPEPKQKVDAFAQLANYLPPNLERLALSEALVTARAIHDESDRASALSVLADKLPQELLPEALSAAKSIQDEYSRALALSSLAEKLPEVLPEALSAARVIQDEYSRALALSSLAEKLPEVLPEALSAARVIQDEYSWAQALRALAKKLPPELLTEILSAATSIQDGFSRANALSALAEKLPPELLPEALAAVRPIQDEYYRANALSALAEKLPPELLPEALKAARAIQDEYSRALALSALVEKLPQELLPEALAAARAIQDEYSRALALSALVEKLPQELLPEALAAARAIQDKKYSADVLSALAEKLPEILPEALAAARAIQDESYRALTLSTLAEKLPELLPEALAATRPILNKEYRASALSALVEKLPPELLPEALAAARAIQDEYFRALALSALADKLPPELLPEALAAVRPIQDEYYRSSALSALALGLSQMLNAKLFPLWQDTLNELSARTRPHLLRDIKALFPVIFALGGKVATAEVARAIMDVGRWWK